MRYNLLFIQNKLNSIGFTLAGSLHINDDDIEIVCAHKLITPLSQRHINVFFLYNYKNRSMQA